MVLSDKIVAAYEEGFSGAYIYCSKEKLEAIAKDFDVILKKEWNKAMDEAEEEYDAPCQEKEDGIDVPATVYIQEDKIYVDIDPLFLSMDEGGVVDNEHGPNAVINTIKALKEKYSEISYCIYIAYEYYIDEQTNGVINYEVVSESKTSDIMYDFVKTKLEMAYGVEYGDVFWAQLQWELHKDFCELEEFVEVLENFHAYEVSEDALASYLLLVSEIDDDYYDEIVNIIVSWDEVND